MTTQAEVKTRRKVHLRTAGCINLGHTRTYCGRVIHYVHPDTDLSRAVVDFGDFDATTHGTLVTCGRCLAGTFHRAAQGIDAQSATTAGRGPQDESPVPKECAPTTEVRP